MESTAPQAVGRPSRGRFIKFIAYLQVIGIILVVFGHSFHQYPDGSHGTSLLIYRMCYNFRMPLFMFVSGFLMMYTEFRSSRREPSFRRFGLVKVRRLLVPYFVLTLVTYFPRAAMSGLADDALPLTARGLFQSLVVTGMLPIPYFWFIQASFLLLLSSYLLLLLAGRLRVPDSVAIGALILISVGLGFIDLGPTDIFGYHKAIELSLYFVAGIAWCRYSGVIDRWLPLDTVPAFCIAFSLWLAAFLLWEGSGGAVVASFLGILMCISGARLLVRYNVGVLDHLVGANYMIFLLSWYFNILFQQVLAHFVTLPWPVHTVLSLFFGIYVPWLGYRFLRRNQHSRAVRCLSFLLGQSFKVKK